MSLDLHLDRVTETAYNKPFIIQRADPYICQEKGRFYFTATSPLYDQIILRSSKTVAGLADAEEKVIWKKHETGPMGSHIWAPELHRVDGKWCIYFAAGDAEDVWRIRPYVLICQGQNPMEDAWVEAGAMQGAKEDAFAFSDFSLDATVFFYEGSNYMIWAEKTPEGCNPSDLYIARMESPTKLATKALRLSTPEYDWEKVMFWVNEGPSVMIRNKKVIVAFSASGTGACYCMGILYAPVGSDLLDLASWTKLSSPVLVTDSQKEIYGPGHNSFVTDENGQDICVFHARNYEKVEGDPLDDVNRHAYLMDIVYDESGLPVFTYKTNQ